MIKRILTVLLALILVFSFISCSDEKTDKKTYEATRLEYPRIWMTKSSEQWHTTYDNYAYWYELFYYNSPFIISYKQIAFLGNFKSCVILGDKSAFLLDAYDDYGGTYDKNDSNDFWEQRVRGAFDIELFSFHTERESLPSEETSYFGIEPIDISCVDRSTGMRKLLDGYYGGFVDVDGVRYIYTHGTLQGIKWIHAGYEFMLCVPEEYPMKLTGSFAARMMDPVHAPDAVKYFNKAFDACAEVVK